MTVKPKPLAKIKPYTLGRMGKDVKTLGNITKPMTKTIVKMNSDSAKGLIGLGKGIGKGGAAVGSAISTPLLIMACVGGVVVLMMIMKK